MDRGEILAAWESRRRAERGRRRQTLRDLRRLHAGFAEPNSRRDEEGYDELCQWVALTLRQLGNISLADRWDWVHAAIAGATTNVTDLRGRSDRIDRGSLTDAELDRLLMMRATLTVVFETYHEVLGEVSLCLTLGRRSDAQATTGGPACACQRITRAASASRA